jgi:hypothetical protein
LAGIDQVLLRFARIRNLMRTRLITAQSPFWFSSPNLARYPRYRPSTSPGRFLNHQWDPRGGPP